MPIENRHQLNNRLALRRLGRLLSACAAMGVALLGPMVLSGALARATSTLSITADQGLFPTFMLGIHDYVVRCTGAPILVSVHAPTGISVRVDDSGFKSGSFQNAVPLATGQEFSIAVRRSARTDHYHVRCLPQDFPQSTFSRDGPVKFGMFTVDNLGRYTAIFDTDGVPVWWMKTQGASLNAQVFPDGTYGFYDTASGSDQIYSLSGRPIRSLTAIHGSTDDHELQLLPNGNYLIDAYVPRGGVNLSAHGGPSDTTVLDGEAEELTRGGKLVWSWNSGDHLTTDDTAQFWYDHQILATGPPYDIVHLNSVATAGNEVLISMRHTDAVWDINRLTGKVTWKLGGTQSTRSLRAVRDPQRNYPLSGQHDARIQPDGTVTIYDNNTGLSSAPRVVRYALERRTGKAKLLQSFSDPEVVSSFCCGSARRIQAGRWLVDWGGNPVIAEYDAHGSRLFKLDFGTGFSYRAIPVPLRTPITRLRAGMNAQYPRVNSDRHPVAVVNGSPYGAKVGSRVSFNSSASYDPDGVVVASRWDFGDGHSASGANVVHKYSRPGEYLLRLSVRDNRGSIDTSSHTVRVVAPSTPLPIACFTDAASPARATSVAFDASGSRASRSTIVAYTWQFGDGQSGSGELTEHAYSQPGVYSISLTVVNAAGFSATTRRIIRIPAAPH